MDWSRSRKKRQNSNSFGFELKIPNNPYLITCGPGHLLPEYRQPTCRDRMAWTLVLPYPLVAH
jgi:hypothetical protein